MATTTHANPRAAVSVDVELPLRRALPAVDLALSLGDVAAAAPASVQRRLQPSLSQLAADLSLPRMRWPAGSRSGYHGLTDANWMRDGQGALAQTTLPAR